LVSINIRDDDMDGEWEAPKIANPEYKGEWAPKVFFLTKTEYR
jgi:hypothetical protein